MTVAISFYAIYSIHYYFYAYLAILFLFSSNYIMKNNIKYSQKIFLWQKTRIKSCSLLEEDLRLNCI